MVMQFWEMSRTRSDVFRIKIRFSWLSGVILRTSKYQRLDAFNAEEHILLNIEAAQLREVRKALADLPKTVRFKPKGIQVCVWL